MKKILAIVLFVAMLFALTVPVSAAAIERTINKATITVDGVKDDAYGDNFFAIEASVDGTPGAATGKIWPAWDDNYMYFYIEIYDKTPNSACDTGEAHFRDSVEVYLDWNSGQGGDREGAPETPYYQVRIQSAPGDGEVGQITGFILDDLDWAGFADWTLRGGEDDVKRFAGPLNGDYKNGYVAEMAVPVPKDYPVKLTEGKKIPFDTQINDNMEGDGRTEMIYINKNNENNGNQWQNPSDCGALLILGGAYVAPAAVVEEAPAAVIEDAPAAAAVPEAPAAAPEIKPAPPQAVKTGDAGIIVLLAVMAAAGVVILRKKALN